MTGFGTYVMTYSKANRLATVNPFGTTSTYTYDAFGTRLKLKIGTNPFAVQIYDLWGHLLTETSSAATPVETDYVYLDDMPLSAVKPSAATISAIHTDRIGTPQNATNAAKTNVWNGNYTPFGYVVPTASITMNLRLPGQYQDSTPFYHNGFRDQFPTGYGGYLEADPIGLSAGVFSNPYNYANQNPMKYIDPLGLCLEDACIVEAIIAGEAVEALSAGVADVSALLEGSGAIGAKAIGTGVSDIITPPETPPQAGEQCTVNSGLSNIFSDLRSTLDRIAKGEPLPYRNDATVFQNREGLLAQRSSGYYTEYVHPTSNISGPGAQRIITGQGGEIYYTPDHYQTFIRLK
jgi:RHS repeat-associated protein